MTSICPICIMNYLDNFKTGKCCNEMCQNETFQSNQKYCYKCAVEKNLCYCCGEKLKAVIFYIEKLQNCDKKNDELIKLLEKYNESSNVLAVIREYFGY